MVRSLLFVLAFSFISARALACGIVYGKDWAFLTQTPEGWSDACHTQAMQGTVITLWPSGQRADQAEAIMYATVSAKDFLTLHEFAVDAQTRFKTSSAKSLVSAIEVPSHPAKVNYELIAISAAPGNREELVAYVEGPTTYFIVVITAKSASVLATHREAFMQFVAGFVPMERK